jgi:hypothetical protein
MRWLMLLCAVSSAWAHPADDSQLRVQVQPGALVWRFTVNLAAMDKITALDADQNAAVDDEEIQRAVPSVAKFLQEAVLLAVNDAEAQLSGFTHFECIWLEPKTQRILLPELAVHRVDLHFRMPTAGQVQDLWLAMNGFETLGEAHRFEASLEAPGAEPLPVIFTVTEPDYLFDVSYALGCERTPLPWEWLALLVFPMAWGVARWVS